MTYNNTKLNNDFETTLKAINDEISNQIEQNLKPHLEETGKVLETLAKNSVLQTIYPWIGLHWLMYILGEVDHNKIKQNVEQLRQQYPRETPDQLANRIIQKQGLEAAKIGVITNLIPPFALLLLGLEFSAITKLQVEMIYQLAATYNLTLETPLRRGENFLLYNLSLGGGILKTSLSFVEMIPAIGPVVGACSDAILLYGLGYATTWLYQNAVAENKKMTTY
ncbi:MAG: hypothetical protein QNJ08_04150 [Crocosphaera sp.]|nr:hypothetical protein [Crocosphaera sp.]